MPKLDLRETLLALSDTDLAIVFRAVRDPQHATIDTLIVDFGEDRESLIFGLDALTYLRGVWCS